MTAKGAPAGGNAHGEAHTPVVLVALWMGCDFGRDALTGITDEIAAQALPWRLKFVNSDRTFASAMEWLNSTGRLSGVISCYEDIKGAAARAVSAGRFPAVWLSRERTPSTRTAADNTSVTGGRRHRARRAREAFVALDTAAVVGEAVRHFRERTGFRSFGFVDSRRDEGWSRLRGDKCLAELRRLGLRGERFRTSSDLAEMAGFLRSMERPAAVLAANDATAA
ncbi:MAG: substrate-binding domain-containing protein, partial [Kiritimatiellae bacterium]|nr:substrate-binding domain-containing protein [Kiritimatiellia bacterium]